MASLIFPDGVLGLTTEVTFDITESVVWDSQSEITDFPVESGVDISDHVRPTPERVSLQVFVTEAPIREVLGVSSFVPSLLPVPTYTPPLEPTPGSLTRGAYGAVDSVLNPKPPPIVTTLTFFQPQSRRRDAYETLLGAWKESKIVRVLTEIRELDDMVIERLSPAQAAEDGEGITFSIDLRRLKIVETSIVAVPFSAEARGAVKVAKGAQSVKAAADAAGGKTSLLKQALNSLGL